MQQVGWGCCVIGCPYGALLGCAFLEAVERGSKDPVGKYVGEGTNRACPRVRLAYSLRVFIGWGIPFVQIRGSDIHATPFARKVVARKSVASFRWTGRRRVNCLGRTAAVAGNRPDPSRLVRYPDALPRRALKSANNPCFHTSISAVEENVNGSE
jgi:hypothetical protein